MAAFVQSLAQCLRGRQAPTEWLLDWIKISTRNGFALGAIGLLGQGISIWHSGSSSASSAMFVAGGVLLLGAAALLSRLRPGRVMLIVAISTSAIVTAFAPIVPILSDDLVFRTRAHAANTLWCKAMPTVLGMPLLPTAALILLSLAADVVSLEMCAEYFNDPRPSRIHSGSTFTAVVWLGLAFLTSGRLRSIFDAQRALAAEKELSVSMISMMCDASLYLSHNCRTILSSDHRFKVILGRDMTGKDVYDAVAEDERDRLKESIPGATEAPLLLPTTLVAQDGIKLRVELFIVGNRDTDAGGQAGRVPAFLIGVRVVENHISGSGGEEPDIPSRGHLAQPAESGGGSCSEHSVPETTVTGHVFARLDDRWRAEPPEDRPGDLQHRLESVFALGEKEQWLLSPSDLRISANRIIGRGSYGVVVSGWLHGTPVAVKMTKHSTDTAGVRHLVSIANEIRILRHVRHPNVVTFHGACVEPREGELAMVLERVLGQSLCHYVQRHSSDSEVCSRFQLLLDTACALRYLHALHPPVVHGDLKGKNIVVEPAFPRAKLLDFGLSRLLTKKAKPLGGSLAWAAPEIICKVAVKPSPSADVFSLGRVACLIITCKNPLERLRPTAIVDMAKTGVTNLNFWQEGRPLHQECSDLCQRLLSYSPEDRPTARQAHRDISAWNLPGTVEQMMGLDLARAELTDSCDFVPSSSDDASPFKALRSTIAEIEQRKKPAHTGRAHRGMAKAVAALGTAGDIRENATVFGRSAPQGGPLCSL